MPVTKKALVMILDEKLDENLKPICLLVDGLKDSVNFLSEKFDAIMKQIEVVEQGFHNPRIFPGRRQNCVGEGSVSIAYIMQSFHKFIVSLSLVQFQPL